MHDEGRENDDEDCDEGPRRHALLQNARGAQPPTPHGPLQRLLEVAPTSATVRVRPRSRKPRRHSFPLSAPPSAGNKAACAWRAAPKARLLLSEPDLGRAPRHQSESPRAARALGGGKRRRPQDEPGSFRSHSAVLSEGTLSIFATLNPPQRLLTVKLRGRTQAPDQSRGCTISASARGDITAPHGPLQRLLGGRTAKAPPQLSRESQAL